jgi:hypothetical protein
MQERQRWKSMDDLCRAIVAILGKRPSPRQRRELAAHLRELADQQEQLAEATERDARRPADKRISRVIRSSQAGPGAPPGGFLRLERARWSSEQTERLIVHIGRSVYYAIGSPPRLDVQRIGERLALVPARGEDGFKVTVRANVMPRMVCTSAADLLELESGRYEAVIEAGVVYFGAQLGEG